MVLLNQQDFDVSLMDIVMPEIDGLECTKKLKEQGVSIPIVSLSGNNSLECQAEYLAAGMSGVLSKPTNQLQFEEVMQQILG